MLFSSSYQLKQLETFVSSTNVLFLSKLLSCFSHVSCFSLSTSLLSSQLFRVGNKNQLMTRQIILCNKTFSHFAFNKGMHLSFQTALPTNPDVCRHADPYTVKCIYNCLYICICKYLVGIHNNRPCKQPVLSDSGFVTFPANYIFILRLPFVIEICFQCDMHVTNYYKYFSDFCMNSWFHVALCFICVYTQAGFVQWVF